MHSIILPRDLQGPARSAERTGRKMIGDAKAVKEKTAKGTATMAVERAVACAAYQREIVSARRMPEARRGDSVWDQSPTAKAKKKTLKRFASLEHSSGAEEKK